MSDDDFFDSPRGRGSSPKKYSWSKDYKSAIPRSATASTGENNPNNRARRQSPGSPVKARKVDSESDSDPDYNDASQSGRPVKQGPIMKIPTGIIKSQNDERSESETDSDDNETTGRSSNRARSRSSSSRSRSRSYSSRSRSGSESRSSASEGERVESRQAWGVESTQKSKGKESEHHQNRPKTGHQGSRSRALRSNDNDKGRYSRSTPSTSGSETESSDTDSDMTDVSPLNSPHKNTPKTSPKKVKRVEIQDVNFSRRPPQNPGHKDLYSYSQRKNRPKSAHETGYEHLLQADKDSVNLKVLMQAILEMEKEKEDSFQNGSPTKFRDPPHSASMIAGSVTSQSSYGSQKNFSFSNNRVREIDRENQRLMTQILKQGLKKKQPSPHKSKKQPVAANHRVTSSALNRMREQQRIDQENMAMLKRLESAKATKTLQKDELNRELFNTTYVGVPLGVIHAQKSRRTSHNSEPSPYRQRPGSAPMNRRPRSATRSDTSSVISEATSSKSTSTIKSHRPGSGKPRPKSAHVMGGTRTISGGSLKGTRPAWEDGW